MAFKKIFLVLSVLILFPCALSVNKTFSSPVTIGSVSATDSRIAGLSYNESVYVVAFNYNGGAGQFIRTNNDFTLLDTSTEGCGVYECAYLDCSQTSTKDFNCIGGSGVHGGTYAWELFSFYPSPKTSTSHDSEQFATAMNGVISSDGGSGLYVWRKAGGNDLQYTLTNNINSGNGDGTIDIPTSYHVLDGVQVRYCDGYYHFISDKGGQLYDLIYDTSLNFKKDYQITNSSQYISWNRYSVWCNINVLELFIMNDTVTETTNNAWITQIILDDTYIQKEFDYDINLTSLETTYNNTANKYIISAYWLKDVNGQGTLFYSWRDGSNYYIKATRDIANCGCSGWDNSTECIGDKIKQTRECYGCNNTEIQYVYNDYCAKQENKTLGIFTQNFEHKTISDSCEAIGTEDEGYYSGDKCFYITSGYSPECIMSLNIPANAINISVKSEVAPVFYYYHKCNKGNYTLYNFLPNSYTSYTMENHTCEELDGNVSVIRYDNTYSAGDTATAKAKLKIDTVCQCKAFLFGTTGGISCYNVAGYLTASYDVACEAGYRCVSENQEAYYEIDCNPYNSTGCAYGCKAETGRCYNPEESGSSGSSDNAIDSIIHPSAKTKFFYGIGGVGIFALLGTVLTGRFKAHSPFLIISFVALGWILFTYLGFIHPIFTVILVLFGALGFWLNSKS